MRVAILIKVVAGVVGALAMILGATMLCPWVPLQTLGTPLPDIPCLVVCNHPLAPLDVAIVDRYIRQQCFQIPTEVLVRTPWSLGHRFLTALQTPATRTLETAPRSGTTQRIVDRLRDGVRVVAFLGTHNRQQGLAWALKQTGVPCFAVRLEELHKFHITLLPYRRTQSARVISARLRTLTGAAGG